MHTVTSKQSKLQKAEERKVMVAIASLFWLTKKLTMTACFLYTEHSMLGFFLVEGTEMDELAGPPLIPQYLELDPTSP